MARLRVPQRLELLLRLVKRDFSEKYKGSMVGLGWAILSPLIMVGVYTFVFAFVFKARWVAPHGDEYPFALSLFLGLTIHSILAECINRAPNLVTSHSVYVTKIPFPLEILPLIPVGAALIQGAISLFVWLCCFLFIGGKISFASMLLILVIVPLILSCLAFSYFLSSLGVYLRDVTQLTMLLTTLLLFLGPIFYPISSIPEPYQHWLYLNPLTVVLEQLRQILMYGNLPNFQHLFLATSVSAMFALLGFAWFQFTRRGFADVI